MIFLSMDHLPDLIVDLALILAIASVTSVIFKLLKQPPVLGYILAGFLASSQIPFIPAVTDTYNVQTWGEIGVIFLLFSLGLDFSFKKLLKTGPTAIIGASTIILGMFTSGYLVGHFLGWGRMNSLFLGGMISMSSTSIIYKALDDLGLRTKGFAPIVLGILVLEDIVAIIMMVMLSTIALKNTFEGIELLSSILKLTFFLIAWFVVGIYLIPTLFKHIRKIINDETLMLIAIGFCLVMVIIANKVGFSAAMGAFVMGSILAETIEAENIERVTRPIKDLFGAIFFVSVGMMVDLDMVSEYAIPILIITAVVIIGQTFFGTFGVLLSGKPLKTALECGFCLTQIGEFAFIIASLGIALKVTAPFLYPIVVSVSVVTTFITPFMIKATTPAYNYLEKHLPSNWQRFLERYGSGITLVNQSGLWKTLIFALLRITFVYSAIIIAILILGNHIIVQFVTHEYPGIIGKIVSVLILLLAIAPFLRAIVAKKNHSYEFKVLWGNKNTNKAYLISLVIFRFIIAIGFVTYVLASVFNISIALLILISLGVMTLIFFSQRLKKQSILIERRFLANFNIRVKQEEKAMAPIYLEKKLLTKDLHLATLTIPTNSHWIGKKLSELILKNKYGIQIVAIRRGSQIDYIPGGHSYLFPLDKIQIIGTDRQISEFQEALENEVIPSSSIDENEQELLLRQIAIDRNSPLIDKSIANSGIREEYNCLVVGLERDGDSLPIDSKPIAFQENDILWIVGFISDIFRLSTAKKAKENPS